MAHPETVAPDPTTAPPPDDQPRDSAGPASRRWRLEIPGAARDVVLVVLGAALALAADEWREGRARARRAEDFSNREFVLAGENREALATLPAPESPAGR